MAEPLNTQDIAALRHFFHTGVTRPLAWRKQQLEKLQQFILREQHSIGEALYADLKKSKEEAYATETGLVLAELRHTLKKLARWMAPSRAKTNLLNWPSSSIIYRDPLGVVLIIAPWNYPFHLSVLPMVAAIAAGNAVVLKPSELAPATAALIERMARELFLPEFVRVIQGDGSKVISDLLQHSRFDHIFFTGSIPVGRIIYQLAAQQLTPVTLELGGKSPAIVTPGADLPLAARRIALGKFTNAGQTCIAPDYLLLHADVKEEFLRIFKETVRRFYGADTKESPDFGRIINESRFDKLHGYLSQGNIIEGGHHDRARLFIGPAILDNVSLDAPLMKEEIFGPILPVFTYHDMKEALDIIRYNPDPLAFYLFTRDKRQEKQWIEQCAFGGGCINNTVWHFVNPHLPFGGIGRSGIGAYHGKYSFETFTHPKPVMKTPGFIDPSVKYPPFEGKLKWFKRLIR